MTDGLDHDSEFFQTWHNLGGTNWGEDGTPANKLWMVGSLLALIEIGGMNEWAPMGAENTLATLGYLHEAGLHELASVFEEWIGAIPGGVSQLDLSPQESLFWRARLTYAEPPELEALGRKLQDLVGANGNSYAAQYLLWSRARG